MDEFPSNSHRQRERAASPQQPAAKKKIERVVQGEVQQRKKPLGRRMHENFVGGRARDAWEYVTSSVLLPAARDMIWEAFSGYTERMIYGDSRRGQSRRRPGHGGNPYVSYDRFSRSSRDDRHEEPRMSRRARANHNFDEIILDSKFEADQVIDQMFAIVDQFEVVTVADLYELVGISGNFQDDKWGWTELQGARAVRTRGGGYLLDLPRPEAID